MEAKKLRGTDLAPAFLQRAKAYRAGGDEARAKAGFQAAIREFDKQTDASKPDGQYFMQRGTFRGWHASPWATGSTARPILPPRVR